MDNIKQTEHVFRDGATVEDGSGNGQPPNHIETQTVSGATTFTSGIDSSYQAYEILCTNLVPSADGDKIAIQVSNDGGSTWQTGASAYSWALHAMSTDGNERTNAVVGPECVLTQNVGTAAGEFANFVAYIFTPADASSPTHFSSRGFCRSRDARAHNFRSGGEYQTDETIDAIRIQDVSGGLGSGRILLRGVA